MVNGLSLCTLAVPKTLRNVALIHPWWKLPCKALSCPLGPIRGSVSLLKGGITGEVRIKPETLRLLHGHSDYELCRHQEENMCMFIYNICMFFGCHSRYNIHQLGGVRGVLFDRESLGILSKFIHAKIMRGVVALHCGYQYNYLISESAASVLHPPISLLGIPFVPLCTFFFSFSLCYLFSSQFHQ